MFQGVSPGRSGRPGALGNRFNRCVQRPLVP